MNVGKGNDLDVDVSYSGNPRPDVIWSLPSGRRLRVGETYGRFSVSDGGSLRINDSEAADSGSYRAIAVNRAGQDETDTLVRVVGR